MRQCLPVIYCYMPSDTMLVECWGCIVPSDAESVDNTVAPLETFGSADRVMFVRTH
jgi:hypothetical protein